MPRNFRTLPKKCPMRGRNGRVARRLGRAERPNGERERVEGRVPKPRPKRASAGTAGEDARAATPGAPAAAPEDADATGTAGTARTESTARTITARRVMGLLRARGLVCESPVAAAWAGRASSTTVHRGGACPGRNAPPATHVLAPGRA